MRRAVTALLLLLAVAAAGCGGGGNDRESREAYGKDLARASETLQKTFTDIASQSSAGASGSQIADRLEQGAKALDDAAKRFDDINPPSDLEGAHRKLVDGLHELAGVFRKAADAARSNNTKNLTATLQSLAGSDGVRKITEAQRELNDKGVTVPTTGGS